MSHIPSFDPAEYHRLIKQEAAEHGQFHGDPADLLSTSDIWAQVQALTHQEREGLLGILANWMLHKDPARLVSLLSEARAQS